MKSGIWALGWCVALGGLASCGGRAIAISDSAGGTGSALGGGGASNSPNAAGRPSFAGSAAPSGGTSSKSPSMADPGSASCRDFTPCGGALEGEWNFDDICTTPALPLADAPYCPTDQVTARIVGSLVFGADGTFRPLTTYVNRHVVPPSCIADLGGCGSANGILAGCQFDANKNCVCDVSEESTPPTETFAASGDYFLLTESGNSTPITVYYCRTGDQLLMRAFDAGRVFVYQLTRLETIPPPK